MKISDVKGERTLDVVAEVIEPIVNIAQDPDASAMFKREKVPDGMTAQEYAVQRVRKSVPVLLKDHKADVMAILAAIKGVTPEEYAESLDLSVLFGDIVELLTDEVFAGFLA